MIAAHESNGFLPAGIHDATWEEFVARFNFTARRVMLLGLVIRALRHFAAAGAQVAYVGGSFVTTKANPGDLDIAILEDGIDFSLVNPIVLDLSDFGRARQKMMFGAEFFPASAVEGNSELTFVEFFQQNRDGEWVGIVALDLTTVGS